MTCKYCINFNECLSKNGTTNYYTTDIACNNVEKLCKHFKNKLRYIELPCSIDDKAYYITPKSYNLISYELKEIKITGFNIDRYGIYDVECKNIDSGHTFTLPIGGVYFDKLKAEKEVDKLNCINKDNK